MSQQITPNYFSDVNLDIVARIKEELRLQGHFFTGELERSLKPVEQKDLFSFVLTCSAADYINDLEQGVPAAQVTVKDFQRLVSWVDKKAGTLYEAQSVYVAQFIMQKWQREGKPLNTSRGFSQTGEILHAIEISFEKHQNEYFGKIDSKVLNVLDETFHETKSGTV